MGIKLIKYDFEKLNRLLSFMEIGVTIFAMGAHKYH